jgi:hypothetical protein
MMHGRQRKKSPAPAADTGFFNPCPADGNNLPSKTTPRALCLPQKMRATTEEI